MLSSLQMAQGFYSQAGTVSNSGCFHIFISLLEKLGVDHYFKIAQSKNKDKQKQPLSVNVQCNLYRRRFVHVSCLLKETWLSDDFMSIT